ncbi:hypothetical protein [Microbacterium schleiferi]|uniref:hypothetical protein n=1 Tax=Microbacterium schleiferi TaxID=69362 RepID=UPI001E512CAE|nr:hypothetical protein [Microbacterium schleiferi]
MSTPLILADAETAVDAQTFASRAARVGDGAVRLRAADGVLVMTCAPIAPRGILDSAPTILGVRVLAVDPELACDVVVDGTSLRAHGVTLELPDAGMRAAWAGISPPVSGWVATGEISSTELASAAQRGMEEVATTVPTDAGEDVVRQIRGAVWGRPTRFSVASPGAWGSSPRYSVFSGRRPRVSRCGSPAHGCGSHCGAGMFWCAGPADPSGRVPRRACSAEGRPQRMLDREFAVALR